MTANIQYPFYFEFRHEGALLAEIEGTADITYSGREWTVEEIRLDDLEDRNRKTGTCGQVVATGDLEKTIREWLIKKQVDEVEFAIKEEKAWEAA